MKRWISKCIAAIFFVAVGMVLSAGILLAWIGLYPEDVDPKNLEYVLWKHGLNQNMNLDHAIAGMIHDRDPVSIIKGLSREQLTERFGYVHNRDQVPGLSNCYAPGFHGTRLEGKEVAFLRDGPWLVIFDHGKAIDLGLCKG